MDLVRVEAGGGWQGPGVDLEIFRGGFHVYWNCKFSLL